MQFFFLPMQYNHIPHKILLGYDARTLTNVCGDNMKKMEGRKKKCETPWQNIANVNGMLTEVINDLQFYLCAIEVTTMKTMQSGIDRNADYRLCRKYASVI